MGKYEKIPLIVDAIQWTGNIHTIKEFQKKYKKEGQIKQWNDETLLIQTAEGEMWADLNDWIIKEPFANKSGREFYPCKPDIFKNTYRKVAENRYF